MANIVVINPTKYSYSHSNFGSNVLTAELIQNEVIGSFLQVKAVQPDGTVGLLTLKAADNGTFEVSFNSANGVFTLEA